MSEIKQALPDLVMDHLSHQAKTRTSHENVVDVLHALVSAELRSPAIMAAPELLDALTKLRQRIYGTGFAIAVPDELEAADAALAKAIGA